MQELTNKIQDEIKANEKDPNIKRIGNYIISLMPRLDTQTKEGMLSDKKTLKGSLEVMKKEAKKVAVDGCGILTDDEGYKIIREYFGITDEAMTSNVIDLNSFL